MKWLEWHQCYESSLTGFIGREAFGHPAKFSLNLINRIYDYMIERGWLKPGDLVGDPFGGVAIGGLVAAYHKLRWIGVELEPRFVEWGNDNIRLHDAKLRLLNRPPPELIQGDSRKFSEILLLQINAAITSPPYVQSLRGLNTNGIDPEKLDKTKHHTGQSSQLHVKKSYGRTDGQIETLSEGSLKAVVSSPPYADIRAGQGGLNHKPAKVPGQQTGRAEDSASQSSDPKYGRTEGQISHLAGIATSPPWESNCEGGVRKGKLKRAPTEGKGNYASPEARSRQLERDESKNYGTTAGNIGNTQKETYWQAMATVYGQCYQALKPGGYMAIVVKDYVKNRKRVCLCDQTAKLLKHLGFRVVERARCYVVNERKELDLFVGETTTRRERKSFFRRLAEANGSPRIDWEETIFVKKL